MCGWLASVSGGLRTTDSMRCARNRTPRPRVDFTTDNLAAGRIQSGRSMTHLTSDANEFDHDRHIAGAKMLRRAV